MNGVGRLPKAATDDSDGKQGDGAPAGSANWMKQLWWKYSLSAQRASPPPRFLLVVLLCAQILFLAIVRLGPSASIWGAGAGTGSSSQASSILYPTLRGNAFYTSVESQEFPNEESKALSSAMNVVHVSDDRSSSSASKEQPNTKRKASLKRISLKKSKKSIPLKEKKRNVASLDLQTPDYTVNAAVRKLKKRSDISESFDELLPSVDDKFLIDPGDSLFDSQKKSRETAKNDLPTKKSRETAKNDSPPDSFPPTVGKEGEQEDITSANYETTTSSSTSANYETTTSSSMTKAQKAKDAHDENAEKSSESAARTEAKMETEHVLSGEEVSEIALFTEKQSAGEAGGKEEQQASFAENGNEAVSNVDVESNSAKQEVRVVSTEETTFEVREQEASEEATFGDTKAPDEPHVKETQTKNSDTGNERGSVEEEHVDSNSVKQEVREVSTEEATFGDQKSQDEPHVEETQAKNSDTENEHGSVKDEPALIEQKIRNETSLIETKVRDETSSSECRFGYIYVYDLPPIFNHDIISNCTALNPWLDLCPTLSNGGLGESLGEASPLGQMGSWYISDQFTAEIVFHNRILQHPCLTDKMEVASGFYVPFYAGLDVGRHLWLGESAERRDMLSNQFLDWLIEQPAWKKSGGSDHIMMIGRITWDFRRSKDEDWGSGFFYKPAMQNMMKLLIERNPWDDKEMAVPYPTNFHPQSDADLVAWQNHIRGLQRNSLFSFAGAPRDRFPDDFRSILFEQCRQAERCRSLDCSNRTCDDNQKTLELFMDSIFCLQPRGDSFTRRSTFDCMLAGSIPVFFWHRSAYMQYKWHLPADEASYSVFISKQDMRNGTKIEEVLKELSPEKVQSMQEAVIQLVPRIVYAASGFSLKEKDAFDVAIEGVIRGFKEPSVSSGR